MEARRAGIRESFHGNVDPLAQAPIPDYAPKEVLLGDASLHPGYAVTSL